MREKSANLIFVEQCFRNIQLEKEIDKNLKLISSAIKREFGIPLEIRIVENEQNTFFGMCIYPNEAEINQIVSLIMTNGSTREIERLHRESVKKNVKYVEIDPLLLYDGNLNASPSEITAILLHEIGHIITTDITVHRIRRMKEYILNNFDSKIKNLLRELPFAKTLLMLPTTQIFSNQFSVQTMREQKADNFALMNGYKLDLISILDKMVINGKGSIIKKTEGEVDKDIEITLDWVVSNVKELEFRKDKLSRNLSLISLTTPSVHIQGLVKVIKDKVFKYERNKPIVLNEAFILSSIKKAGIEKAPVGVIDKYGFVKKLDTRDLDIYRAELERVKTTDDKIFLLERLYDLRDHALYALDMIEFDKRKVRQSETTVKQYVSLLNELISQTNAKKVSQERYGLFIKYPEGYEG